MRPFLRLSRPWAGLACLVLSCLTLGCQPNGPVELPASPVRCVQCQMTVVDPRFVVQEHTTKGRVLFFDSVECAQRYAVEHRDQIRRVYLRSFLDPPRWIEGDKAWVVRWAGIRSPMGGNLAAFASREEARAWLESMGAGSGEFSVHRWSELNAQE